MTSWRALVRCGRERGGGPRHDLRKVLDRELTSLRYFALFESYSLCPQCGLRNAVRPLAWLLARPLRPRQDCGLGSFEEELAAANAPLCL